MAACVGCPYCGRARLVFLPRQSREYLRLGCLVCERMHERATFGLLRDWALTRSALIARWGAGEPPTLIERFCPAPDRLPTHGRTPHAHLFPREEPGTCSACQGPRCLTLTERGGRCERVAFPGARYCSTHLPDAECWALLPAVARPARPAEIHRFLPHPIAAPSAPEASSQALATP